MLDQVREYRVCHNRRCVEKDAPIRGRCYQCKNLGPICECPGAGERGHLYQCAKCREKEGAEAF